MEGSCHTLGVGKSLRIVLKELSLDHNMYGFHSLRTEGATSTVSNNSNLSERLLKLHERRKSDMYVLEDVSTRLQISSRIGL